MPQNISTNNKQLKHKKDFKIQYQNRNQKEKIPTPKKAILKIKKKETVILMHCLMMNKMTLTCFFNIITTQRLKTQQLLAILWRPHWHWWWIPCCVYTITKQKYSKLNSFFGNTYKATSWLYRKKALSGIVVKLFILRSLKIQDASTMYI